MIREWLRPDTQAVDPAPETDPRARRALQIEVALVLLVTFGLDGNPALGRVGSLVRHLENGGTPVAEAPGFEAVLAGLRAGLPDDDALLAAALPLLDALYRNYSGAHS